MSLRRNSAGQCSASPTPTPPAALEGSLVVLAKLKELEFHSRANLERLAELTLTVEDELKQKEIVGPLGEVYSAQRGGLQRAVPGGVAPRDVIDDSRSTRP